jgi:CheY-like chemotaxis protein
MKFLVVSQDASSIAVLSSLLAGQSSSVEVVRESDSALLKLPEMRPDCLVTDWLLPGMDGVELTRRARALAGSTVRIIVTSEIADAAARAHVIRAGADLYLVKPLYAQQVLGAVQSLRKQATAQHADAARAVLEQRLMKHDVWTQFERLVTECLQGCTNIPLRKGSGAMSLTTDSDLCAALGMVDPSTRAEVHYAIRFDRGSGSALARSMLGAELVDDDALLDIAGELCNNLLGQSKTMLRSDGFGFALAVAGEERPRQLPHDVAVSKCVTLLWGTAKMLVSIGLRATRPTLVRARDLSEHMVVMEDVKTPQGALLVPSGTRLTAVTAERLMRHLPNHEFRVATVGL